MMRACAAAILLFAATLARADPTPSPPADPDAPTRAPATTAACGQAKDEDGHRRLNRDCLIALAFDPKTYFETDAFGRGDALRPGGVVDAVYIAGRGGPRWAFAIDTVCDPAGAPSCQADQFRLVLRAVTIDRVGRTPPEWIGRPPQTEAEMRRFLAAGANWREADLRSGPGATKALLSLEDVPTRPFDDWTRGVITGLAPDQVVVIADANTIRVRAGGVMGGVAFHDTGGADGAGDWAQRMLEVAKPCLKPAAVPAPWELPGR
jgi:hypothetical protein